MSAPRSDSAGTVLIVNGARVQFEGVVAVDAVDLELRQGEIVGLIGPNGAGKTTFMNALSGFVPMGSGSVFLDGVDVTGWKPERLVRLGLVRTFQDIASFARLTVFENVELGALASGLGRRVARRRTWELLESLNLGHLAPLPASALAHGDARRVGLARAVAASPRFLLLDEPAAGLNDHESAELTETVAALRRDLGCGVLLVEHDMRMIFSVCDRIQVLDYGKLIAAGSPAEIRESRAVVAAYLGATGAAVA